MLNMEMNWIANGSKMTGFARQDEVGFDSFTQTCSVDFKAL